MFFAEDVGLSVATVRTYRWVAAKWPTERRVAGVSWEVHKVLASAADPFEVIAHPPPNERTGRRAWDGDAAKRAVRWKAAVLVTVEEKVEAVTELVRDEAVACRVAVALLKRRRVVFVAMRDGYPDYGLAGWPREFSVRSLARGGSSPRRGQDQEAEQGSWLRQRRGALVRGPSEGRSRIR
ncbi:DUF6192 family protein [Streptomyces sp. NBC_00648]|uniref:DUF6192 family protein n=1 Tax=Streptomyces sp. NBC_00648 TaxID=2975797 RepID=UPI00386EDC5D